MPLSLDRIDIVLVYISGSPLSRIRQLLASFITSSCTSQILQSTRMETSSTTMIRANGTATSGGCGVSGDTSRWAGLWLVETDHVTWILASDWLICATYRSGVCRWRSSGASGRGSRTWWWSQSSAASLRWGKSSRGQTRQGVILWRFSPDSWFFLFSDTTAISSLAMTLCWILLFDLIYLK